MQNRSDLNLFAGQGVAIREVIMAAGHGRADYLLYVDQRAADVPLMGRRPVAAAPVLAVHDLDAHGPVDRQPAFR